MAKKQSKGSKKQSKGQGLGNFKHPMMNQKNIGQMMPGDATKAMKKMMGY